jgi:hypothetical protein
MELIKDTTMTTIMELLRSKSEEEVYDYLLDVEDFLAFFRKKSEYLDIDRKEYEWTGAAIYITDRVFFDIEREVDKINLSSTVFWGDIKDNFLIDFNPYYEDCEDVARNILKQLKKYYEIIK